MSRIGDFLVFMLVKVAMLPFQIGSLNWARWLGRNLGVLFFHVAPIRKRVLENHLHAFFGWEGEQLRAGVREAYIGAGLSLAEFAFGARLRNENVERYVTVSGLEHYHAAHASGRSVIIATGHMAIWEWAGTLPHFLDRPIYAVTKRIHNTYFDEYVTQRRTRLQTAQSHLTSLSQTGAVAALKGLAEQAFDYILFIDHRAAKGKGTWINLRGHPVAAMPGAAILALRGQLPILPMKITRTAQGIHMAFQPALDIPPSGNERQDVQRLTQVMNDQIAQWVAEHPRDYFWFHDHFKLHDGERAEAEAFLHNLPAHVSYPAS